MLSLLTVEGMKQLTRSRENFLSCLHYAVTPLRRFAMATRSSIVSLS